jgi:hypothetical protein
VIGAVTSAVLVGLASQWDDLRHALTTHDAYVQGRWMALATVLCVLAAAGARYAADGWLGYQYLSQKVARRGLAAVVVIGLVVLAFSHPIDRIREFSNANDIAGASAATGGGHVFSTSGTGRSQFWGQAIDAFESEPVIGIGAGNYELWWNQHHTIDVITIDAHSLYLQTLAELGIVGILLLLGFLGTALYAGWRAVARRPDVGEAGEVMAAALAVFLAGLTSASFDWTWQLPAAFAPVIVMAALLSGPASQPVAVVADPDTGRLWMPGWRARSAQYGLGVATLLCAWVAIWVAGDQLIASVQLDSSRSALARGDFAIAAQSARNASAIQPWSSEAQLQLALAEKASGDLAAATAAVREAVDRASHDWRPWLVAAEVAAAAGNRQDAEFGLAVANKLSPRPLPVKLAPQR